MAKGRRKYKMTNYTGTVSGAIEAAASEARELHGEMEEWAGNMENNSMEHLPKYDEVSEARDALEEIADALEQLDVPQSVADMEISYTEMKPYGRKPMSRSMRLSNAESQASAAKDAIEAKIAELRDDAPSCECEETPDEDEAPGDHHELDCPLFRDADADAEDAPDPDELQQLVDDLDQADFMNVNFPGMF